VALELHNDPDRTAKAKAEEMLHAVKLGNRINYYPSDLSGGQKQRVAFTKCALRAFARA
jgi:putative ABC transport system ATP-binding protein